MKWIREIMNSSLHRGQAWNTFMIIFLLLVAAYEHGNLNTAFEERNIISENINLAYNIRRRRSKNRNRCCCCRLHNWTVRNDPRNALTLRARSWNFTLRKTVLCVRFFFLSFLLALFSARQYIYFSGQQILTSNKMSRKKRFSSVAWTRSVCVRKI